MAYQRALAQDHLPITTLLIITLTLLTHTVRTTTCLLSKHFHSLVKNWVACSSSLCVLPIAAALVHCRNRVKRMSGCRPGLLPVGLRGPGPTSRSANTCRTRTASSRRMCVNVVCVSLSEFAAKYRHLDAPLASRVWQLPLQHRASMTRNARLSNLTAAY